MHFHDRTDWPAALVSITLTICLIVAGSISLTVLYFVVLAMKGRGDGMQALLSAAL